MAGDMVCRLCCAQTGLNRVGKVSFEVADLRHSFLKYPNARTYLLIHQKARAN